MFIFLKTQDHEKLYFNGDINKNKMIDKKNEISRRKNENMNKNTYKNERAFGKEMKISKSVSIETFPLIQEKNMKIVSLVIHLPSNHFRKVRKLVVDSLLFF